MIRLGRLLITEFRGIRSLELDLDNKSYLVHGPNGTGKSGVVDAIDFALTGSVARLSGAGTGAVSVLRHAPHVIHRDNASEARVELTFTDSATGATATLTRCVRTAKTFSLSPDTPALRAALARVANHPELTLTRREVLKFVLAEPGKRSDEVQALLKLDRLGALRKTLKTANGQLISQRSQADAALTSATRDLSSHIGRDQVLSDELLEAVNHRREVLAAAKLTGLNAQTDFRAGVDLPSDTGPRPAAVIRSADEALNALNQLVSATSEEQLNVLQAGQRTLEAATAAAQSIQEAGLARVGLQLLTGNSCPLCDTTWASSEELRAHITAKVESLSNVQQAQDDMAEAAAALRRKLSELMTKVLAAISQAEPVGPASTEIRVSLTNWHGRLGTLRTRLDDPGSIRSLAPADLACAADEPRDHLLRLRDLGTAMPDISSTVQASEWLTLAQERWARLLRARSAHDKAAAAATTGAVLYETYCRVQDAALEELFRNIEARFADHYQKINEGDEDTFKAQLEPDAGKLGLTVDFYSLGMFPPGAYHSEGHQDGMGLALYLALLEHLLGDALTLVVLDDVITSIDIAHRRRICDLLRDRFPAVQFVITTHEQIWAETLLKRGVVGKKNRIEFHSWSVDDGPLCADTRDVYAQIATDLARTDVPAAAAKLRRHLEASMRQAAADLRAKVVFSADATYALGDLLPAVSSRYKELLAKGAKAAAKWNNTDHMAAVARMEVARKAAVNEQNAEGWAINRMVHDNPLHNLTVEEFGHALDAARLFLSLFVCDACQRPLFLEGYPDPTSMRCPCAATAVNLQG